MSARHFRDSERVDFAVVGSGAAGEIESRSASTIAVNIATVGAPVAVFSTG